MAAIHFVRHRRPRQFRRIDRQFTELTDEELRQRYRFSADNIDRLVELLGPTLERRTRRNQALTPQQQILITLRFLATGNFMQVIGDTFDVDISAVSLVVRDVTDVLFGLKDQFIKSPVMDLDRRRIMSGFYAIRGFPSVIGCIDGTHVKIISPGYPFVNRKHQHSINVQGTCNHKELFTSINACWPGSCHESHILRVSNVGRYLEAHHQGNETEERYNRAHISTRNLVERTFGIWKRTFHDLHGEIRMKPQRVTRVIVACAVLHNLRLQWGEPEVEEAGDLDQPPADIFNGRMDGRGVRDHVAHAYFQNQ
ncbi:putative nuclease HARBI1 [Mercenaria mercenaria]|uniref:putative nuclease HARBI1 n=1 Tax=Mercenaria mercenaria TaxID=6596 RepID=UPI00234E77A1|nr:putative nuclease HARBI1 [Mercenaria mercenaria]